MNDTAVIIPNLNGVDSLAACLDSLLKQSFVAEIIVVENRSTDNSLEFIKTNYPNIILLPQKKNLGFAGGVNIGIRYAMEHEHKFIALFNNDAVADKYWLQNLRNELINNPEVGIATCKFVDIKREHLDSTGDIYTIWGLPYPRGRGEPVSNKYDDDKDVFAASGGASLYRSSMLEKVGLFDEDFFAYYEDVDLSFRAQLAGWKVQYVPESIAYHQIGATSSKIKGFTTYQTMKNLPMLLWKNVPIRMLPSILSRFLLAYAGFFVSSLGRGQASYAVRGSLKATVLFPKKTIERHKIQSSKKVSTNYIKSIITHDLPPNAAKLRTLRNKWRKITGNRK